jgi:hypothetical protein
MDQAHEQVSHLGTLLGLIEQAVFAMKDQCCPVKIRLMLATI